MTGLRLRRINTRTSQLEEFALTTNKKLKKPFITILGTGSSNPELPEYFLEPRLKEMMRFLPEGEKRVVFPAFSSSRVNYFIRNLPQQQAEQMLSGYVSTKFVVSTKDIFVVPNNMFIKLSENIYLIQYTETKLGNSLVMEYGVVFIGNTTNEMINNFIYQFSKELYTLEKKFKKNNKNPHAFDELFLPKGMTESIMSDVDNFVNSRKVYEKELDIPWKRGYVLIGPPGCGKTKLIRCIKDYYSLDHCDIQDVIDHQEIRMGQLKENTFDTILFPTDHYPTLVSIEDVDKFVAFQAKTNDDDFSSIPLHQLLKAVDGVDSVDSVLLIATTNHPENLSEALINRPGRFDMIWKIDKPVHETIVRFLKFHEIQINNESIENLAKMFDGLSMAFVESFVKSIKTTYRRRDFTFEECKVIIDGLRHHDKMYKDHFSVKGKFGFSD